VGRADQKLAEGASHSETGDLGGENQEKTGDERFLIVIEQLLQDDDIDGVGTSSVAGSHGSNQDVLLDREGTRVEGEFVAEQGELAGREDTSQEVAKRERHESDDRVSDLDSGLAHVEELVHEGDDTSEEETEEPHAEGVAWD